MCVFAFRTESFAQAFLKCPLPPQSPIDWPPPITHPRDVSNFVVLNRITGKAVPLNGESWEAFKKEYSSFVQITELELMTVTSGTPDPTLTAQSQSTNTNYLEEARIQHGLDLLYLPAHQRGIRQWSKEDAIQRNLDLANLFHKYDLVFLRVGALDDALTAAGRENLLIALDLADAMREAGMNAPAIDTYRHIIGLMANTVEAYSQLPQLGAKIAAILAAQANTTRLPSSQSK